MSHANRNRLRMSAATVAAGAITVAGGTLATSWAALAQAAPAAQQTAGANPTGHASVKAGHASVKAGHAKAAAGTGHSEVLRLALGATPTGRVVTGTKASGEPFVEVSLYGLTPGSRHEVTVHGRPVGSLTADAAGQATGIFDVPGILPADRVRILSGGTGTGNIAVSAPTYPGNGGPYPLRAMEHGFKPGATHGTARLVYDPATATITVTVSAWGVSPGRHAVRIDLGSCASQGPVQYLLPDFTANSHGAIHDETRVATGVTAPPPVAGWYLSLHQGNSNNILSNGQPATGFRPLLCADIAG